MVILSPTALMIIKVTIWLILSVYEYDTCLVCGYNNCFIPISLICGI